ncbi:TraR/DksA family transcriptional regulator [Cupriavidus sp. KK10]|jgi:DnaK suppressor protein|uniref:TraR/DksA family transcriptional regulator n=1 Tax=Cupriavidus sp. KK10 TaxID=1478019 RepID=UPI001BABF83F|nr:TraR/DksA family transcriptional regulator [Cupriavidus sp. KK10]QUN26934.1 TraR/DksA family transcriptional regulator [Cupriavidus sp. KK10]
MEGLTKEELAKLVAQMDAEELRIRAVAGTADSPVVAPTQREQLDDGEMADEKTVQRQGDAMLKHYRMQLADIEAARSRMRSGQYGVCIDCQQAMQAYPTAMRCTACQNLHEHSHPRQAQETRRPASADLSSPN